jgi:hypothetical protein
MTTYHVAKFDCLKSSRLAMQSNWDIEAIYIHKSNNKFDNSYHLSISVLSKAIKSSKPSDKFIFHAQSSLIYLIFCCLFLQLEMSKVVYDIHDLNTFPKRIGYSLFRSWIMCIQELIVLRLFKVKSITVSLGLALIISRTYRVKRPSVIRNISVDNLKWEKKPRCNRLIYFGTFERLSDQFFNFLEQEQLEADVYGRYNIHNENTLVKSALKKGIIHFKGEYDPKNLDFLHKYDFLYYNIEPTDINYRFAGPNKIFQALGYGLSILIPRGYSELNFLLSKLKGSVFFIQKSIRKDINNRPYDLKFKETQDFLENLKLESKRNYQKVIFSYDRI